MSDFQQVLFVLAASGTLVLVLLLVLMIFGGGSEESFDGDVDGDLDMDDANDEPLGAFGGLRILTIRGAFTFLAIGGWTAYGFSDLVRPVFAVLLGVLFGAIAAVLLALVFRSFLKLENKGNLDYKNAIGKIGTVYIKVPKNRSGMGKVNITFQEHYVEVDAVTDESDDLTTGMTIEVLSLENQSTVIVQRIKETQKIENSEGDKK
jgi:hypothetical protein